MSIITALKILFACLDGVFSPIDIFTAFALGTAAAECPALTANFYLLTQEDME